MSKVYAAELNFYLSRTIDYRFWRTLHYFSLNVSQTQTPQERKFHEDYQLFCINFKTDYTRRFQRQL